ncbi:MAG: hypothetical protein WDO24_22450 [Pseudomonadota bacterium]
MFVDGRFEAALSTLDGLPKGVTVESLAALIARDPAVAEAELATRDDSLPLVALNTAFVADGLVLRLARGAVLDKPLHLISVGATPTVFHPRHLIRLEPDAVATVVESHVGSQAEVGGYFATAWSISRSAPGRPCGTHIAESGRGGVPCRRGAAEARRARDL